MSAKKSKGTSRPKATAAPATRRVYCEISDATYAQLVEDYGLGFSPEIVTNRLKAGTLIADDFLEPSRGDKERAKRLRWTLPLNRRFFILPAGMANDLERLGRRELGFTLAQSLSFILQQNACVEFASKDDDDDAAGEEWKKGGVS